MGRIVIGAGCTLAALIVATVIVGTLLDAGFFREQFIRTVGARLERTIKVDGALELHVLSLHPRVSAAGLTLGNPAWMPAGQTADIGKLSLAIELPWFGRSVGIERLELVGATLYLRRDSSGNANWQWTAPGHHPHSQILVRSLSVPQAHVELDDDRRHLKFDGMVSATEEHANGGMPPLRLEGDGNLNGRPIKFSIDAEPLATADRDRPYHFTFSERSGDTLISGHGFLPHPFNFDLQEDNFESAGPNLKDLYYLTGVTLVNTGPYHLSGKLQRRGTLTQFTDLAVTSGQSDARGSVSIETVSGRPNLNITLHTQHLRAADLGTRAAGLAPVGPPLLLSDAMFNPGATRRADAVVSFYAQQLDIGRIALHSVATRMTFDHGMVVAPVTANLLGGQLTAHLKLDAASDDPIAEVDLKILDAQLGQLGPLGTGVAPTPPVEGLARARLLIKGHGRSLHQVAASANGTITATVSHGAVRAALAELTDLDLRGLGLLLDKNATQANLRCGVASFQAQDGVLTAQTFELDTDPVLITGEGTLRLDSETLDLTLRGRPKAMRLVHVRSHLLVRGTLSHPTVGLRMGDAVAQTAAAVALGVVLTPLASVLAFVDPDLAKDADCAALLAPTNKPKP
jgi:AsmA family protein